MVMRWVYCLIVLLIGCRGLADDRVALDQRVGYASTDIWQVQAEEGAAVVRDLSADELSLWMSAPQARVRIENKTPTERSLVIRAENLLPAAGLVATFVDGTPIALPIVDTPRPTARTVRAILPAGAAIVVREQTEAPIDAEWSFLVFGDVQGTVGRVGDLYARMNDEDAHFALMVGDLTERGTRAQLERFDEETRALRIPLYATLGNHELDTPPVTYHAIFGRGSYRFDYGGLRFVLVDSGSATVAPRVYQWLEGWLAEPPEDRPIVFATHIPPIDPVDARSGGFVSRLEGRKLLATLTRGNVIATFYGHIHTFLAFSNAGIPAYITGGGGAIPDRWGGVGRHYLRVRFAPATGRYSVELVRIDI